MGCSFYSGILLCEWKICCGYKTIAEIRGVNHRSILAGAGSSDLLFLVLRQWLTSDSRVLILDPTYGEYAHILEQLIQCRVDRFPLLAEAEYQPDIGLLEQYFCRKYDLIVIVNPNKGSRLLYLLL